MRPFLLALPLLAMAGLVQAYDAVSSRGDDLSGHWKLNEALSDDVEEMLQARFDKAARQHERRMQSAQGMLGDPARRPGAGPEAMVDEPAAIRPPPSRRNERFRRVLGMTRTLHITQEGRRIQIASEAETRRFEAGARSQVSMPGGGLADSRVGWKGQWFAVDRRVRGGIRVVERYRWLKGTDQLETTLAVSGDDFLAGMKIKRIYDRIAAAPEPRDPAFGPVP